MLPARSRCLAHRDLALLYWLALLAMTSPVAAQARDPLPVGVERRLAGETDSERFDAILQFPGPLRPTIGSVLAKRERVEAIPNAASEVLDFLEWKLTGGTFPAAVQEGRGSPSLLLISIDTLRADHLGCYGYSALPGVCRAAARLRQDPAGVRGKRGSRLPDLAVRR